MPWWGWLIAIGGGLVALYYAIILVIVICGLRQAKRGHDRFMSRRGF